MLGSNDNYNLEQLQSKILKLENEIENLTQKLMFDSLTGAFNRRYLEEIEQYKWDGKICYVSFVDSNKLKTINDNLGHAFGDMHLVEVVNQLKKHGKVIRYGGDEFVVLSKQNPTLLQSNEEFSVGKFVKHQNMQLVDAITEADKDMYKHKNFQKNKSADIF